MSEVTGEYFERLVYSYDISSVYDFVKTEKMMNRKIRLLLKNGDPVWYNVVVVTTKTKSGEEMWFRW